MKGTALYALANTGDKVISFFVLIPVYVHYLTPAAYGIIALSDSIAQLIVRALGLSLDDSFRRLYFQYVGDSQRLTVYVSTILRSMLAIVGMMVALSFTAVPGLLRRFAPHFDVPFYPYIAFSLGAAIGLYVLQYRQTLFQVESAAGKYLALSSTSFLVTVGFCVSFVVAYRMGAFGMLLGKLSAGVVIAAIALLLMRQKFSGGWHWPFLRETVALSLPLIPHYLTAYGLDSADRFILARYRTLEEVGVYSLAYTVGKSMYIVTLSVHQAWSPTFFSIARHGDSGKDRLGQMTSMIAILLTWIAMAGTLGVGIFIDRFLDARYHPAARVAPWIIGSFLFQALYTLSMLSAMQAKRSILLWASSSAAFAANVLLNFLLVPRYGMYGAAYANLLAFAVIAITMYFSAQRVFHVPYRLARILGAIGIYTLALAITQWKFPWPQAAVEVIAFCVGTALMYLLSGHDLSAIRALLQRKDRVVGDSSSLGS